MIVIMDMASGSRLDDEGLLPCAEQPVDADRVPQPTSQLGPPQLGLQLVLPQYVPHSLLREAPRDTEEWARLVYPQ